MVDHTNTDILRFVRIQKVIEETPTIRTIMFKDDFSVASMPGQFVMVWIPRVEERPMSVGIESFDSDKLQLSQSGNMALVQQHSTINK